MFEENEPLVPKPLDLERLSEDELQDRIQQLKQEIAACEAELARKQTHKSAADELFGGGS